MTFYIALGMLTTKLGLTIPTIPFSGNVDIPTIIIGAICLYLVWILREGFISRRRKRRR